MFDNDKDKNVQIVESYHKAGLLPDRYYYQLNGKSAQENYADQKNKISKNCLQVIDDYDDLDYSNIHITSEVRIIK